MLRVGKHPTGGGCLCLEGDCNRCLATVDGVSYVRTCQRRAQPGLVVERDHRQSTAPPLPLDLPQRPAIETLHRFCDTVIIGGGSSGNEAADAARARQEDVVLLDAKRGEEVIGIYPGPLVVARVQQGLDCSTLQIHPRRRIVVATGASAVQPVVSGSDLRGLLTPAAARRLLDRGFDLGRTVLVGGHPCALDLPHQPGDVVRFEGNEERQLVAVVLDHSGVERRVECDSAVVSLGLSPRSALARMAGRDSSEIPIEVVGDAALEGDLPRCPPEGVICPCSGVTVEDLEGVFERGFEELELVKRATLAGTGTCQGSTCLPYLRSFLADRGTELQPPFTARPVTRQLTLGEIASGAYDHATPRTELDAEHRRLGATMERAGGWWRPWTYNDPSAEYWSVRSAVSLCDVGTLGKMQISGPDALRLLEWIYPTKVATLGVGRTRYVLMLDERGYVLDDGLVARESDTRYTLTFTSGGSSFAELWMRDWAEGLELDVRILNQTASLGAINVTGPLAARLLARSGVSELPGFAAYRHDRVCGVDCQIFRLSFTGELSYELHHSAGFSVSLWRGLLELGRDLGVRPHGLRTLLGLRLEKGHIVVGQDTDYDSTPRRIDHEWAVKLDKEHFVGRQALLRTNAIPLDRRLVGFELAENGPAPIQGASLYVNDSYAGYLTSSEDSPVLGKPVMLGWIDVDESGAPPSRAVIDGRDARVVEPSFYDPENERARAKIDFEELRAVEQTTQREPLAEPALAPIAAPGFTRLEATRIVASPEALDKPLGDDGVCSLSGAPAMRTADDEVLVFARLDANVVAELIEDEHAIVLHETSLASLSIESSRAHELLARHCAWELPRERPAFAQGAVAEIPVKLWLEDDHVQFVVSGALVHELEERLR